jgi:hypothetical protein
MKDLPKKTDPPMLLQLKRQAIRNFPNGERVALYSNPQLKIQIAVPYDPSNGSLKPTNVLQREEHNGYSAGKSREDIAQYLENAWYSLKEKDDTLSCAIRGWLQAEIQQFGFFNEMPEENLRDNWDDYCALMAGADIDLHQGKPIKEETINEDSVIRRLQTIVEKGEEAEIKFDNGESSRVHPITAKAIIDLYDQVNTGNQRKLSQKINTSFYGLNSVANFAMTHLRRNS